MRADIAALAYLASGVLFVLALRGLSSPETARTGNSRGMVEALIEMELDGTPPAYLRTMVLEKFDGLVWTDVSAATLEAAAVLAWYRCRWQIGSAHANRRDVARLRMHRPR